MNPSLFHGQLVRLAAPNLDTDVETFSRWTRDSEYLRLQDSAPARPESARQFTQNLTEWLASHDFLFAVRALADDRLLGFIELEGLRWAHGDAWVGIGLGEREVWGRGYGTDAMRVMLRFAFTELNLRRVSLTVYEYNPRAIRSYEKAGFVVEGRVRQCLNRDGRRWDMLYMGILKEETT
jgi:RimJ/RimL family protein N-acetyltransferase